MIRNLAVLNSDQINLKRIRFSVGALEGSIFNAALHGIPYLVGHDALRPIGWMYPFGLFMEPGLTRLVGEHQLAETQEDFSQIHAAYHATLNHRFYEECEPHRDELEKLIKEFQSSDHKYYGVGCAACVDHNILHRIYPFLKSWEDKDGLIDLKKIATRFDYLGQGVFKDNNSNLAIFCHPYLRRSLSRLNNVNFEFMAAFMALQENEDYDLRLAFDPDAIGLASSFHAREEMEYVFGPQYSDNLVDIKLGVTRHESDDRQKFFSQVSRTEFWWKNDQQTKILEAEELRDDPTNGRKSDQYGCRYIHTIYDSQTGDFHFDGAIRSYDPEEMIARLDQPINKAGKNTQYRKLFRADGKLQIDRWKLLITFYFSGNPLVYEYFGMKHEYDGLLESGKPKIQSSVLKRLVPYHITPDSGVRLFLSYHVPAQDQGKHDRIVIHPDSLKSKNGERVEVMDFHALEIKKVLNRTGAELIIPEHIKFVNTTDSSISFPTIRHKTHQILEGTIAAYRILFERIMFNNPIIAFTLAWPLEEREVRLSIFGKLSEVKRWLSANHEIPGDYQSFRKWIEQQSEWLSKAYKTEYDAPHIFDLICSDGVITIGKQLIDSAWTKFTETDDGRLACTLNIPADQHDLLKAIDAGEIRMAGYYLVKRVKCSKTGEDYFLSKTSQFLDKDVRAIIHEVGHPFGAWTA